MRQKTQSELKALIRLLDDPDEEIFTNVKDRLLSYGQEVIPVLEYAWEQGNSFNHIVQTRIENIIHKIQLEKINNELVDWAKSGATDLLRGAFILAKYQYPDLNEEKIKIKLDQITQDVWLELNDNLTALEKVKVLNHIVYEVHGFSGNTANFHDPENSYINHLMESKKGNPLSLSIIYCIIAQKLEIPIFGVNLPQHFILAYQSNNILTPNFSEEIQHNVLFYVNPFSKGSVFAKKEIDNYLKQVGIKEDPKYYKPCNNIDILKRAIQNLIFSYDKLGHLSKTKELKEMLNSVSNL